MARLPNAHHVIIDDAKLEEYALNPNHPDARHKARVFAAVLGYDRTNRAGLVEQIRRGVLEHEAVLNRRSRYGVHYQVDIPVTGPKGSAPVRTGWIVREGEHVPRLATIFVLRRKAPRAL